MKISIDLNDLMKTATADVIDALGYPVKDIEITDDPNQFIVDTSKATNAYLDEFISDLAIEFTARVAQNVAHQLAVHGITIEDS